MVTNQRITSSEAIRATSDIEGAYANAGGDAEAFWTDLAARVNEGIASYAAWGGGVKSSKTGKSVGQSYTDAVLTGLQAYKSNEASEYANSWERFYEEVIKKTVEDALAGAKGAADKVLNPWWLAAAAALVLGVIVLQGRR
jgi:hypothetical protein